MRRLPRFFTGLLLLVLLSLQLSGCGPKMLYRPSALKIDPDTLTLGWRAVPDAQYYTVSYGEVMKDVRNNFFALEDFPAGDYEFKVKACGNGETARDSAWSDPVRFTREEEPGMGFRLINNNTEYEVSSLGSAEGEIVVPDTYRGKPVTKIGDRAFANRNKLLGVTLGEKIKEIGVQAFYNCTYLRTVNLPSSLERIGEQAFQSCRALNCEMVIPIAALCPLSGSAGE